MSYSCTTIHQVLNKTRERLTDVDKHTPSLYSTFTIVIICIF